MCHELLLKRFAEGVSQRLQERTQEVLLLKGNTIVCVYRLLSVCNRRRRNNEFLTLITKSEIPFGG